MRNPSGALFGQTVTVKINVSGAPPAGPTTPAPVPGCSGTPNIASFTASPNPITAGGSTTLSYGAVTNADSAEIDQGIGGVETPGSKTVSPPSTTTYTLTARCGSSTQTAQVTVTVNPPPPATPAAPTGFVATGTGTTIAFTWTDNSTNELGFRIYQVGEVAPVVTLGAHTGTGGMAYNWTGRPCNVSATYYVRAYNAAGESASSNTNSAVTIPCAPTGFIASGASQSSVNVWFTDNATNESGFRVYRTGYASILETLSAHTGTGAKTGTVSPVICGQTYAYYVKAYNSAGESAASTTNDATTAACTVTVNFTSVLVTNDTDCDTAFCIMDSGAGEIHLDFNVNGQAKRWPLLGHYSITDNETKAISGISYTFSLFRTQNLTISVTGTDEDTATPDDSLGTANATYVGALNWSEGNRHTDSVSPNYFRIYYTISVSP